MVLVTKAFCPFDTTKVKSRKWQNFIQRPITAPILKSHLVGIMGCALIDEKVKLRIIWDGCMVQRVSASNFTYNRRSGNWQLGG